MRAEIGYGHALSAVEDVGVGLIVHDPQHNDLTGCNRAGIGIDGLVFQAADDACIGHEIAVVQIIARLDGGVSLDRVFKLLGIAVTAAVGQRVIVKVELASRAVVKLNELKAILADVGAVAVFVAFTAVGICTDLGDDPIGHGFLGGTNRGRGCKSKRTDQKEGCNQ